MIADRPSLWGPRIGIFIVIGMAQLFWWNHYILVSLVVVKYGLIRYAKCSFSIENITWFSFYRIISIIASCIAALYVSVMFNALLDPNEGDLSSHISQKIYLFKRNKIRNHLGKLRMMEPSWSYCLPQNKALDPYQIYLIAWKEILWDLVVWDHCKICHIVRGVSGVQPCPHN